MSKDPFEELFGPREDEPQPVPARERLQYEQAERVRTAQLPMERGSGRGAASGPGDDERGERKTKALPWIIVGIVAVLAIVASIVVVNIARGGEETPAPEATSTATPTAKPTTTAPPTEDAEEEEPEEDPDQVPAVEVGPTSEMQIVPWGATSQFPQRLGSTTFSIPDNVNLILTNDLLNSFPDSCAAMRQQWGAKRLDNGTYEVLRPAERCAAAPELYDEMWGLVDAWVQTIKPAG